MERLKNCKKYLNIARAYAEQFSGCKKVAVGSVIVNGRGTVLALGANRAIPDLCKCRECLRVERYGEDSKAHRNPEDCRAIHSEIDAISNAAQTGTSLCGAAIYVTRYPCEACAKAIISAGISQVIYGGTARISEQTQEMFDRYGIANTYISDWMEDDSDR